MSSAMNEFVVGIMDLPTVYDYEVFREDIISQVCNSVCVVGRCFPAPRSLTSCGRVGSNLGIVVTDISSALFALRNFALEFQAICRRRSFELRRVLSSLRRRAPKHSAVRVINASGGASSSNITIHYEIMKA